MTAVRAEPLGNSHTFGGDIPTDWTTVHDTAPQLAGTMLTYLDQVKVSLRPTTIMSTNTDLRIFATFLIGHDPALERVADIERHHIEAFKIWQNAQPGRKQGQTFAPASFRRRITHLRMFFIRITEWDWDDAPPRVPIFFGDTPKRDESLPKFLDDAAYAKFMRALTDEPHLHRRVAVELLARTGMRVGELCDLEADAVTTIGDAPWLRIPVGKLHNDRYVPLHPELVDLLNQLAKSDGPRTPGRLLSGMQGPLNRHAVTRWVKTIARRANIGHVHPHQLRHTLATQAINRGMSIEAIAALLGHKSLDMTRNYARIANRVVADEYAAVTAKVEALYTTTLPADTEGPNMARLRTEHHRMLGNGFCTRPPELHCHYESICETCTHYQTDLSFQPVLLRQRDHALQHGQDQRANLYNGLLDNLDPDQAPT